jgi:NADH:ubiquinone oxidoreductase subunit 4 (subunit M)
MLWMYQRVIFGAVTNTANEGLKDLSRRENLVFAPLLILIFVIGLFPNPILSRIQPSIDRTITLINSRALAARNAEARVGMREVGIEPCCPDQGMITPGAGAP